MCSLCCGRHRGFQASLEALQPPVRGQDLEMVVDTGWGWCPGPAVVPTPSLAAGQHPRSLLPSPHTPPLRVQFFLNLGASQAVAVSNLNSPASWALETLVCRLNQAPGLN